MKNDIFLKIAFALALAVDAISPAFAGEGMATCEPEVASLKAEIRDLKERIKQLQAQPENDCISTAQRSVVGTRCRTLQGIVFVRLEGAWKDTGENGKTWHDAPGGYLGHGINGTDWIWNARRIDQYDADKYCKKKNQALPTKEDFELAEAHGFREILKDIRDGSEGRSLWSSTVLPRDNSLAYVFFSTGASIGFLYRQDSSSDGAARCVDR